MINEKTDFANNTWLYWLGKIKESCEATQGDPVKLNELTREGGKRRHAERVF